MATEKPTVTLKSLDTRVNRLENDMGNCKCDCAVKVEELRAEVERLAKKFR